MTIQLILRNSVLAPRLLRSTRLLSSITHLKPNEFKDLSIKLDDGSRINATLKNKQRQRTPIEGVDTVYKLIRYGQKVGKEEMCGQFCEKSKEWKWRTFDEMIKWSDEVGQAIRYIGIPVGESVNVGLYSKNRTEWLVSEMALHSFSNVSVPLYDTIAVEDMIYILNLANIELIFTDTFEKTTRLLENKQKLSKLAHIVQFEPPSEDLKKLAEDQGVNLYSFSDFTEIGRNQERIEHVTPTHDTVATISFTSGTTGKPKGAVLTHGNMAAVTSATQEIITYPDDVYLSYLPIAHIFERAAILSLFTRGCKFGFFRGEPQHLMEDFQSLEPFLMITVPRITDKVYKGIQNELNKSPIKKAIVNAAIAYKQRLFEKTRVSDRSTWVDKYILSKIQNKFGSKLRYVIVGAAKSDPETLKFLRAALGVTMLEGYGQTESAGISTFLRIGDDVGSVGVPAEFCSIKLEDVPELDYTAEKNGAGEILVKGYNIAQGYYKNEEATKETFLEDGYMRTGDIGRWSPIGNLEIIDRCKNVLKLSQGKFVAPEHVESIYKVSQFVSQIYVHGELSKPFLVAVVVPDAEVIQQVAVEKLNIKNQTLTELCRNEEIKQMILDDLVRITKDHKRPRYEGVYAVHLTPEEFSVQNGLMTPTAKTKRVKISAKYSKQIAEMYDVLQKEDSNRCLPK